MLLFARANYAAVNILRPQLSDSSYAAPESFRLCAFIPRWKFNYRAQITLLKRDLRRIYLHKCVSFAIVFTLNSATCKILSLLKKKSRNILKDLSNCKLVLLFFKFIVKRRIIVALLSLACCKQIIFLTILFHSIL